MPEDYILEDRKIKFSVFQKIPSTLRPISLVRTKDMDNHEREVFLCVGYENGALRKAYFCIETGEYVGDTF